MRCSAVPCLEAEERQSSCHCPWEYMGCYYPSTSHHTPGHAGQTCSPPKLWLLKLALFQPGVEPGKSLSLHLSSLWRKFLWPSASHGEVLSFPRPTV